MKGDVERVLSALNQANVRYMVVGGVIALKRQAGRSQDLADIEALEDLENSNNA